MSSPPGWYPDPSGAPGVRYFDGQQWTGRYEAHQTVIEGSNHVLHGILTLFTWPLCGGWGWVWLFVALNNKKHVRIVR